MKPGGFRLNIPLLWLLELDSIDAIDGIEGALGDRYLCLNNSVFRNIRRAALQYGYRFSSSDSPLWRDYQSFGLATLHRILSEKTIPYLGTTDAVRRIVQTNPAAAFPPQFIVRNIRHNHVFHESAHCVAHSVLEEMDMASRLSSLTAREQFVTGAILEEAFANTVETLASLIRSKPLSDLVFYSLNAYGRAEGEPNQALVRTAQEHGPEKRFHLLLLSYFEANLATERGVFEVVRQRIAGAAGHEGELSADVLGCIRVAFGLNSAFRNSTTPGWFDLLGYKAEYCALAESGWLDRAGNREFTKEAASRLWEIIGGATEGRK